MSSGDRLWHQLSVDESLAHVRSSPTGLASAEAAERLGRVGPNEIATGEHTSPWKLLAEQFRNVLVVILLLATVLSAVMGHALEAGAIAVIVLFAVLLGFLQEFRAERAIQALRRMAAPLATVLRDGDERTVPARDLVPGDVILIRAGAKIPADVRLLEAVNLKVEEAALTGESVATEKQAAPLAEANLPLGDRTNMAFAGTAATYGRGVGLVVATGMATEFGRIAKLLQTVETSRTPLQQNLDKVGRQLARAAFVVVAVVVAIGLWRGQPFVEMFVFGIALAVAVVPEALPAVVTISLAIGVQRMARRNALMRRLPAVETLGSTSVICSDKTGTLTKDEMTVRQVVVAGQRLSVSGAGYEPVGDFADATGPIAPSESVQRLLQAAVLSSDARIVSRKTEGRWEVQGDPTEGALIVAAAKARLSKADLDARFPRVAEIPFTSESKRMTTLHRAGESAWLACAKGAPEVILDACVRHGANDGPLDDDARDEVLTVARELAGDALRVLGVSSKSLAELPAGESLARAEREMSFLGLVGMIDPPRPEAQQAIRRCEAAGIRPVMITGDHPVTARAVARELGLLKQGRVVTGADLETMSDAELEAAVETIDVYARVSPAHKLRVVSAWQRRGHVVAMTGDGVNDAPALKKADIGVAMGIAGTDVTREAAAMTLTDDNFASIVAAVEEGRGVFDNIKKYLMYLLSSNIGEMGLMVGTSLMDMPLPLTAVQILYVNLATDGLPALALAVDPPDDDLMHRPPRAAGSGIFTRPVVTLLVCGGVWSGVVNLGLFAWSLQSGRTEDEARSLTFVTLVLIQFFKAYSFRSDRRSAFHRPFANGWLNLAIAWELVLLAVVLYVPFLQRALHTQPLGRTEWLLAVAVAATVVPVLEFAKWCERRGWFGEMN